jgi:TonB family protein
MASKTLLTLLAFEVALLAGFLLGAPARVAATASGDLVRAAANGSTTLVRKLIDEGADIEETNPGGLTPLMASAEKGSVEVIRMLLDAGAVVNRGSPVNYPALTYAAFGGHFEVVELLLARGARTDMRGETRMTPLLAASTASEPKSVRLLLEKGADIEATDNQGRTSLMFAAAAGEPRTIDILIAAGADVDARSTDGYTALALATIYQREHAVIRLGGDPTVPEPAFTAAARMGTGIQAPRLEKQTRPKYTADALHRRREGETLLEVVITAAGQIEAVRVKKSIDIGLDLNAIACVREWRFTPGMVDGAPVNVFAEIAVTFQIV